MDSINPYQSLLNEDTQMLALEADLQKQIAANDKAGAVKDIEEMQSILTNMSLAAHGLNFAGSSAEPDILNAQQNLNKALQDIENGTNSGSAVTNVGVDMSDIRHLIIVG